MLAHHAAMEALGRFANLIATAQISERLCEAMACTSLVAAKSVTKGELRLIQTGTTLRRLVGTTPVAHDKDNLRQTVGQAQFVIAEPAGIELIGHTMQALMRGQWRPGMVTTGLHKCVWRAITGEVSTSAPQPNAALAGVPSTRGDPTDESNLEERQRRNDGVYDKAGLDQGDPFSPVAFAVTLPLGEVHNAILHAQRDAEAGTSASWTTSRWLFQVMRQKTQDTWREKRWRQ